ncbi:ectomycorrhiza regulated esterase [Pseudozyma hubeiensis SY62]|uniref:Ectomycorrhiza regulated esterase n=1 Tax=Pseudozyma hubeiensis (strain SY62) TaxID=1305764 RepID=R9PH67_PSEHS|nr:ectomycorrhiza regulated esterase [Pseudozyma hubeiensis SY62]GAC97430.1 ectomycorrhiza regulated esterase [Pseudozyma hubeiensis SY62]
MRETKLHIPMTTATGETIGIVGILAQIALPPHNPQEHEPHPMYTSRSTTASIEPLDRSHYDSRSDISNDPTASNLLQSNHNRYSSRIIEDDPATMQRLRHKDQAFKRRGYPIYPIDKRDTRGLKIAIILHGLLAHKDQIYHKQLARALPVDSFRFDFRANGETPGTWSMGNLADDVEDLVAVVNYLRTKLEYTVEIIIGHSRGGLDGFAWFAKHCPDALPPSLRVPFFVGLSARFNMANIHERDPVYLSAFAKEGFFRWQARVAGQQKELHVYPEQVEQFAAWPTREIALAFPYHTDVLLIHGTADKSVPASDVTSYGNILSGVHRRPGSCSIKLIDHADHLFRGFYPQVVEAIVEWLAERSELTKMGLSAAAIRDKESLGLARFDPNHYGQGRVVGSQVWDNNLAERRAKDAAAQASPWLDNSGTKAAEGVSPYQRYLAASVGGQSQQQQQGEEPPKQKTELEQVKEAEEDAANTTRSLSALDPAMEDTEEVTPVPQTRAATFSQARLNAATSKVASPSTDRSAPVHISRDLPSKAAPTVSADDNRGVSARISVSPPRAKSRL